MNFATIKWARDLPLERFSLVEGRPKRQTERVSTPIAKYVLLFLATRVGGNNKCFPDYAAVAADTGLSTPTVERAIKRLVECRLIQQELRRDKRGRRTSSLYTILAPTTHQSDGKPEATTHQSAPSPPISRMVTTHLWEGDHYIEVSTEESSEERAAAPSAHKRLPSEEIVYQGGKLTLEGEQRGFWLKQFGGNERLLRAGLLEAGGLLQKERHSPTPLEAKVGRHLGRIAGRHTAEESVWTAELAKMSEEAAAYG